MHTIYEPLAQLDEALMMLQEEFAGDDNINDCMDDLLIEDNHTLAEEEEFQLLRSYSF